MTFRLDTHELKPPYKSSLNQWYTKSLFYEVHMGMAHEVRTVEKPPFTLNIVKPGYICARTTFVELGDPTGYQWAMRYLGDWTHWQKLMQCKWFVEAYNGWVQELETKARSEAIIRLQEIAASESPQAISAAKYLASLEYKKSGRGRPSKEEVAGELKKAIEASEMEREDYERIRAIK